MIGAILNSSHASVAFAGTAIHLAYYYLELSLCTLEHSDHDWKKHNSTQMDLEAHIYKTPSDVNAGPMLTLLTVLIIIDLFINATAVHTAADLHPKILYTSFSLRVHYSSPSTIIHKTTRRHVPQNINIITLPGLHLGPILKCAYGQRT